LRRCYIDGELVRIAPSWNIVKKINALTTANFIVIDLLHLDNIDNGDSIELFNGDIKIFSGIVLNHEKYEDYHGILSYSIQAVDNSKLADKRLIAKVYENQTAGNIARGIIAEKLAEEGVTEGIIQDGPVVKKAVFNYIKCTEALDYLKTITGYSWNIDKDKKLNFFERSTYKAPFMLSDDIKHHNFRQKSTMDKYRNTQYVRGGRGKTAMQEGEKPTPKPDGHSRNFIVRFPLAERPIIELKIGGGAWTQVNPNDIGVNGLDNNKKWYFSYGSNIITQDDSEAALDAANGDDIRITYTGLRNLFVKLDDSVEIDKRKLAEPGTSGIYEDIAREVDINDSSQLIQYTQGLIETYAQIQDIVTFNTYVDGLEAGQLLRVKKPLFDIDDDFLIESISIRPDGPNLVQYSVTALDGAAVGGWEEFFKKLLKGNREFVIAENEVVILLQSQSENEGYRGSTNIKTFEALYPTENLYPDENLYPGTLTSEVAIDD